MKIASETFRIVETRDVQDWYCGHWVQLRLCEELVGGKWEPFISGGVCLRCRRKG